MLVAILIFVILIFVWMVFTSAAIHAVLVQIKNNTTMPTFDSSNINDPRKR